MKNTAKSKSNFFLTGLLFLVSFVALVFFAMIIKDEVAVNRESSKKLALLEKNVAKLSAHVAYQNEYYERLLNDEEFIRRIIKQKFGYTYPDEIVFKFKDGEASKDSPSLIE